MGNKNELSKQVVDSKNSEVTPPLEKKSSRVLILTMLSALFILSVLLILFITGVLSGGKLDIEGSCEYKGEIYTDGESFPLGDGCNSCICNGDSGSVVCTNMPCVRDDTEEVVEEETEEEDLSELELPSDIYEGQVAKEYIIEDRRFLVYQRPNMNLPIPESNNESGVLYADEGDTKWKPFIKVRELADSKNNVFLFDYDSQLDSYTVFLIDANGGGSGEGVAKLVSIGEEGDSWDILNCFYYSSDGWFPDDDMNLRDEVEEYLEDNPQHIQDMNGTSCTDFEIVKG
jgi:hypothetical protein